MCEQNLCVIKSLNTYEVHLVVSMAFSCKPVMLMIMTFWKEILSIRMMKCKSFFPSEQMKKLVNTLLEQ